MQFSCLTTYLVCQQMPPSSYRQPPPNGANYFQPSSTSQQKSHITAPFMPGTQPMGGGGPPNHMQTTGDLTTCSVHCP